MTLSSLVEYAPSSDSQCSVAKLFSLKMLNIKKYILLIRFSLFCLYYSYMLMVLKYHDVTENQCYRVVTFSLASGRPGLQFCITWASI